MFAFSWNKILLFSVFCICTFGITYADDKESRDPEVDQDSSEVAARDDRRGDIYRDQRYNDGNRYGGYGSYGGYGGGYYQQNPQYPYDAFPDQSRFDSIYERNSHPPR